jgi:hypothetical protein
MEKICKGAGSVPKKFPHKTPFPTLSTALTNKEEN